MNIQQKAESQNKDFAMHGRSVYSKQFSSHSVCTVAQI